LSFFDATAEQEPHLIGRILSLMPTPPDIHESLAQREYGGS